MAFEVGSALNVDGRVVWPLPGGGWRTVVLFGSSIATNDDYATRTSDEVAGGWAGKAGYIKYSDMLDDDWVTYFRFTRGDGGQLAMEHMAPKLVVNHGDPEALDEAGVFSQWGWAGGITRSDREAVLGKERPGSGIRSEQPLVGTTAVIRI
jgi:hypothetical protein